MKKQINKILGFTFIISVIFFNTTLVNAAKKCPIEETPRFLEEYIVNVHKVVSNTNILVSEKYEPPEISTNYEALRLKLKTISNIQGSINRLFTWEGYETNIEYTTQGNIGEIPKQLKRDVNLLQKESKNLKLAKPAGGQIEVKGSEICKGVKNCNFKPNEKYKALEVIELLKKSTNEIKNIIKNQANDYSYNNEVDIYLLNPKQLLQKYSKENIKICNLSESANGEKGTFAKIKDGIKKILTLHIYSKNGMSDWKEAVDLIYGRGEISKYRDKEREVLAREIQRQGIGGNNASAIMSNLDTYNKTNSRKKPFMQGKQGFFNSLQLQLNEFDEVLEKKFPGYKNGNPINNKVSTKDVIDEIKKLKKIENTNIDIKSQYNKLKSLAIDEDINNDDLLYKMIDIHLSISSMINTLNKTCPIAVKVCNDQKRGQGDCGQCY